MWDPAGMKVLEMEAGIGIEMLLLLLFKDWETEVEVIG